MSAGFGLPALGNLAQSIAGIGDAYEAGRKRTALARLGEAIQGGDYSAAASAALDGGDTALGLGLLKYGEEQRKTRLGERLADEFAQSFGGFGGGNGPDLPGSGARSDAAPATRNVPVFADGAQPASDYTSRLFTRESNNDPNAQASTSSARGLGQFVRKTWNEMALRRPDLQLTPVGDGQDGRTDPQQMLRATEALTADNTDLLRKSNLPTDDASVYSLHIFGGNGGRRFVAGTRANPDAPAYRLVNPDQVAANRALFYDRSGRARSAGEVMSSFARSFGGGRPATAQRGRAGAPVDVAETEAETQQLEQRMGMVPPQVASAEPDAANLPADGAFEAMARDPGFGGSGFPPSIGGIGSRVVGVPSSDPNARNVPGAGGASSVAVPMIGGAPQDPGSRSMSGVEPAPAQVAQAGGALPAGAGDAASAALQRQAAGLTPGNRIPLLMRYATHPNAPEGTRQMAQTLLKSALDEAKLPDGVKEFFWARANGMTQARSPGEYEREKKGPSTAAPGSAVLTPDGRGIDFMVPERNRSNVADDVEARREAAGQLGLQPGSPAYQSYVLTGKMPREDQQPLTASDKKAILEADDGVMSAETAIGNLKSAKDLSAKAYAGPLASWRGWATGAMGSETGQATQELDNLVTTNALGQLKAIFGAAPTEGERKILLEIQGSSSLPHALRVKIYDRAIGLAERRLEMNRERAGELRGGTYYRPGSGPQGDGAPPAAGRRALPPPSPSNRPGAAGAAERFDALTRSGLSKEQAYQRLQSEGY